MTIDVTRSIHPDLLDEYQDQMELAAGGTAETPQPRRRRGRGAANPPGGSPPGSDQAVEPSAASTDGSEDNALPSEPAAPPEWLTQLRATDDPKEILGLLTRNIPREDLSRDDVLAGLIGDLGNKRARQMLEEQEQQRQGRARQEAYDKGDLYTLGQLEATNLQAQRQQVEAQMRAQNDPYMAAIRNFQAGLPEAVQREVGGKNYDSYGAYLTAVQDAAIRHGVSEEVRKRSGALDKAELSQTVGSEQSPELDGGPAQAYREITDAQVAAMTLEEYDHYFDDKGRPKPGVRVRLDRGIDINREIRR
jgi:hypothetical protein